MTAEREPLRLAVCDDESALTERLEELARGWSLLRDRPCRARSFSRGEALLFELAEGPSYDLLLLDVEMAGMDGVTLARRIRETDRKTPLAFLTNHPGYVFQGYEVSALRYLLKPVKEAELFALLDLAWEQRRREKDWLLLTVDGQPRRVDQEEIVYLEAQGHAVRVRTAAGELTAKTAFSALSRQLGKGFAAPHRSYLVNLRYVERVSRTECFLESGERLPVSRGAWEGLNRAFIDYYRGK